MGGKVTEQQNARRLRAKGKSINEIAHSLQVSKSSVSVWVRNVPLKKEHIHRLKNRELQGGKKGRCKLQARWKEYRKQHPKPIPKPRPKRNIDTFFDKWTPNMAYVLGFFAADGCMYINKRGSHYVAFYSADRQLILMIKKITGVSNAIERYQPKGNRKERHTLQIGSRKAFSKLTELGFTPNKSLTLKFPEVPDKVLGDFVRGYFDGDGCISANLYQRSDRQQLHVSISTRFISGNKLFLNNLHQRLIKIAGVKGGSICKHNRASRLLFSINDTRQLYKFMYPTITVPCLKRKRNKFNQAHKYWTRSLAGSKRLPVTQKIAGSNPVGSAIIGEHNK